MQVAADEARAAGDEHQLSGGHHGTDQASSRCRGIAGGAGAEGHGKRRQNTYSSGSRALISGFVAMEDAFIRMTNAG